MDYAKITHELIKAAEKYVKAELKKDANNLYSLKAEWWLPAVRGGLPRGEYAGEIVNLFSDGQTTLVWYNPFESTPEHPVCDGASRFPDRICGINLVPGSIALYSAAPVERNNQLVENRQKRCRSRANVLHGA